MDPQPLYIDCDECPFSLDNRGTCDNCGNCVGFVNVLLKEIAILNGDSEAKLMRPFEDCPYIDASDGTCAHPEAMTPECHYGVICPVYAACRKRLDDVLGLHDSWPLSSVLEKLREATSILLDHYSYDGHGHELLRVAADRAEELLDKLNLVKPKSVEEEEEGKAWWTKAAKDLEWLEKVGAWVRPDWRQDPRIKHTSQYRGPK